MNKLNYLHTIGNYIEKTQSKILLWKPSKLTTAYIFTTSSFGSFIGGMCGYGMFESHYRLKKKGYVDNLYIPVNKYHHNDPNHRYSATNFAIANVKDFVIAIVNFNIGLGHFVFCMGTGILCGALTPIILPIAVTGGILYNIINKKI